MRWHANRTLQYEVNKAAREQRAFLAEALAGQKEQEILARRAAGREKAAAAKAAKEAKAAEADEARKQLKAARKERRKANALEKERERKKQARATRRVDNKRAKRRQAKEASCKKQRASFFWRHGRKRFML